MYLFEKTKATLNDFFQRNLGITLEAFMNLDAEEQQNLIQKKAKAEEYANDVPIMIGAGEHSCFINVEKGTKVMLEDGVVIEAGLTSEEFHQKIGREIDAMDTTGPKWNKIKKL